MRQVTVTTSRRLLRFLEKLSKICSFWLMTTKVRSRLLLIFYQYPLSDVRAIAWILSEWVFVPLWTLTGKNSWPHEKIFLASKNWLHWGRKQKKIFVDRSDVEIAIASSLPTHQESITIQTLFERLKDFRSVTLALEKTDMDLHKALTLSTYISETTVSWRNIWWKMPQLFTVKHSREESANFYLEKTGQRRLMKNSW